MTGALFDAEAVPTVPFVHKAAWLSADGTYRYALTRTWNPTSDAYGATAAGHTLPVVDKRTIAWVMLNPSTADALVDDPTIRRVYAFSRRLGQLHDTLDGLVVVNVFALRATKPRELVNHPDPRGPDNDDHIGHVLDRAGLVIAAWGASYPPRRKARVDAVRTMLKLNRAACLGKTSTGEPRHPLYLKGDTALELL